MPRLLENYALAKRPKGRADAFSQAPREKTNRLPLPVGLRLMGLHRSAGKVLVKLFQKLAGLEGAAPLPAFRRKRNPRALNFSACNNLSCRFYLLREVPAEQDSSSCGEHSTSLSAAVHPLVRGNGAEKHRLPVRTAAKAIRLYPNGWTGHVK